MNIPDILNEIQKERFRQVARWGEEYHTPIEYVALLSEELGEVSRYAHELHWNDKYYSIEVKQHLKNLEKEAVQVAALCVALIESQLKPRTSGRPGGKSTRYTKKSKNE